MSPFPPYLIQQPITCAPAHRQEFKIAALSFGGTCQICRNHIFLLANTHSSTHTLYGVNHPTMMTRETLCLVMSVKWGTADVLCNLAS